MQRQTEHVRTITYAFIFQLVKKYLLYKINDAKFYENSTIQFYFSTSQYGNTTAPRVLTVDIFFKFF